MREHATRRTLLAGLTGVGGAALLGGLAVVLTPSADAGTARTATAGSAGETATQIAGQSLVPVPANSSFAFTTTVTNSGTGESSPISEAYWLGQNQVTNAQYKAFLTATGHKGVPSHWTNGDYPTGKGEHPVLFVSAEDAATFCTWLAGAVSGWTFRLPTEAEWENAARGPNNYAYPWGSAAGTSYSDGTLATRYNYNGVCAAYHLATAGDTLATYDNANSTRYGQSDKISSILSITANGGVRGWIDHSTYTGFVYTDVFTALSKAGGTTTAVGTYPAGVSAYGCYDMAGNAWEWTSSTITAQNGAEKGAQVNAVRGGSWYATGRSCQTSYRGEGRAPSGRYNSLGFRVAAVQA